MTHQVDFDQSFTYLILEVFLAIFISRLAYRHGYYQYPHSTGYAVSSVSGNNVAVAFAIFFFVELIFVPQIYMLWLVWEQGKFFDLVVDKENPVVLSVLNLIGVCSVGLGLYIYFLNLTDILTDQIWGKKIIRQKRKAFKDFILGSVTWIIAYPWILLLTQVISMIIFVFYGEIHIDQLAVQQVKDLMTKPIILWLTIITVVGIVPIIEELLFRGFFQTWLKGKIGRTKAIIITSIVFACFHYSSTQGIENLNLIPALFFLSCYLGFVRERQESIWASIGLHSTFNCMSVIMILT